MFKRIFSEAFLFTIALSLYSIYQFVIILVLSNNYSVLTVGDYSFAISVLTPIFIFAYQSYRTYIVTGEYNFSMEDFIRYRIIICSVILVIGISIIFFINNSMFFYVLLFKIIEGISDLIIASLLKDKEVKKSANIYLFRTLLTTIFLICAIIFDFSIDWLFIGIVFFYFFSLLFYDFRIVSFKLINIVSFDIKDIFNIFLLWKSVKVLVFSAFLGALLFNIPKYFLSNISIELLGEFTLISSLSIALNLIAASIGQGIQPWLVQFKNNNKKFIQILVLSLFILILAILGVFLLSYLFFNEINYILNKKFEIYDFFVVNMLFIPLYLGQLFSFANLALNKYKVVFYINFVSVFSSILLCSFIFNIYNGLIAISIVYGIIGLIQILGYSMSIYRGLKV